MSSLAAQLAQSASLNSALLADRSRRKAAESYLFTGREADQHDLESIHALAVNGLLQLASLEPSLRGYEAQLFSEQAKATNRTLLSSDSVAQLDKSIAAFFSILGPYVLEIPTGKVLEWLVRRFRINEFNVDSILTLFLPYHESPHFAKMLTILHIKPTSIWSFLVPFRSAAQSVPRISLVTEMLKNTEVARVVTSLLPAAIKAKSTHRALIAFNAATLHDFIIRSKTLDEGTLAYLLPALLEPLQQGVNTSKDAILGSYILIATLSQRCQVSSKALSTIVSSMAASAHSVSAKQFVNAILSVLEPQEELANFTEGTVKSVLKIQNIESELQSAFDWIGIEKLFCPLLAGLGKRLNQDEVTRLSEVIVAAHEPPTVIMKRLTTSLLEAAVAETHSVSPHIRRLLSNIHQRHSEVFEDTVGNICQSDEAVRGPLEQLVISLTVAPEALSPSSKDAGSISGLDMIVASSSADSTARKVAVKDLLKSLANKDALDASEMASIRSALLARVLDDNTSVLEVLYSEPSTILSVFSQDPAFYIDQLTRVLATPSSKPKKAVVKAHFTFVAAHFCKDLQSPFDRDVFYRILYPFLLFSKPRQHTADTVWEIISEHVISSAKSSGMFELLAGCIDAFKSAKSSKEESAESVDKLSHINKEVSSKIAENIMKSNEYTSHLDTLLVSLQDSNAHVRALSYLITYALLRQLSGEHRIEAANKIMEAVGFKDHPESFDFTLSRESPQDILDDASMGRSVVLKPSSQSTLRYLQTSLLALVAAIPRPTGMELNWFTDYSLTGQDHQGPHYVGLMRSVYRSVNLSVMPPTFVMNLLETLFANLGGDTLAFLAAFWSSADETQEINELSTVALHHGIAFLTAHIQESDGTDFQTILPSLLVALQSQNSDKRRLALECVVILQKMAEQKFSQVYKFDTVYGSCDQEIQYLDQADVKKYLSGLLVNQDHFVHDSASLNLFHQEHFARQPADKKREAEYKHRVLCYLLSHVTAFPVPSAQAALLKSIEAISDRARAQILQPTIRLLLKPATPSYFVQLDSSYLEEFTGLVLSCFDLSVVDDLNNPQSILWETFMLALRYCYAPQAPHTPRTVFSRALTHGLFSRLKMERQLLVCQELLTVGMQSLETHTHCKELLSSIVEDVPLIVQLLNSLQPQSGAEPRANKRARTLETTDENHSKLTLLLEVLGTKSLPGSLDIISTLLDTINRVVQSVNSTEVDVSYMEQLLMSAIDSAAAKIVEAPNLAPSAIRLDILVELIRVADNPQTFHQALLLISSLARLAPDSVLHNVMPVFTFMGSNVFHRDDSYSFKVVQQTVDSIVPVMVASLKRTHSEPLDLYIGSRDFLRVFTDAANHIPRHRRTKFFSHLVDVLGYRDFLAPVTMLLVDKVANRIVRQNAEDAQSTLALPMSILHHFPSDVQPLILTELLHECRRLAAHIGEPEGAHRAFLDISTVDERSMAHSLVLKRRAQALVIFVGFAVKASANASIANRDMSELISALIVLATLPGGETVETTPHDISQAARASLNRALVAMSAVDFIYSVSSMLETTDVNIQAGALDLLAERINLIADDIRHEVTPTINVIVERIRNIISSPTGEALGRSAMQALRSIGLTLCPGEEATITAAVPFILAAIQGRTLASHAMSALSPLSIKLGPRIIPYFREIIACNVAILKEGSELEDTYNVLHGLLSSIPTFWSSAEITLVLNLHVERCAANSGTPAPAMMRLMKSITKRAPTKSLLPAVVEMWSSVTSSQMDGKVGYLDILTKTLRNASRPAVLENVRSLFKIFLEAFDSVSLPGTLKVESGAISAFRELVVKLNDAAFRPLFRRLYDWAFADDNVTSVRRITFCHIYVGLLDFFKGLMSPYMSFLLQPFVDHMKAFSTSALDDTSYWICIIEVLTKSLSFDDGSFWREDKLRQIASPLIQQVAVCIRLNSMDGKAQLQDCLNVFLDSAADDTLLKAINLDLLMHTRSEDTRLKIFALTCSTSLWQNHGGKLLGFVSETATFIAECNEDENDMVVRESFRLKDAVESVAGNINGL